MSFATMLDLLITAKLSGSSCGNPAPDALQIEKGMFNEHAFSMFQSSIRATQVLEHQRQ